MTDEFVVYVDGACSGRTGGWAYTNPTGTIRGSGADPDTTNNRMELEAVIRALSDPAVPQADLLVVTDSAYVSNCFLERWYDDWRQNAITAGARGPGWRTNGGKVVKNQDLWEELIGLVESWPGELRWLHVRGHGKRITDAPEHVVGNDMADRLAVSARLTLAREQVESER